MIGRQLHTNMTEMNLNDNQISNITLATNINVQSMTATEMAASQS